MENTILKEIKFDDRQFDQILNSIEKRKYKTRSFSLMNKITPLVSASVILIMFLGITYFAGTQINFFGGPVEQQTNDPKGNTMITDEEPNTEPIEEENLVDEETLHSKIWRDVSEKDVKQKLDFPTNVNDWVTFQINEFSKKPEANLPNGEYDEGYNYYLKSQALSMTLGSYIRVEGEDLEKDFENLFVLSSIISHEQFVRTAHIDPNGEAIEKTEYAEQWKATNKRMKLSFEYMKQLLNDIDVVVNKGGEGEVFGVTHQLDGDKVAEMESFISYFEE